MSRVLHTDQSPVPSEREKLAIAFAEWASELHWPDGNRVFNAPYGVIQGLAANKRERGVTFGIARRCDLHLSIYNPTTMTLRDSRFGDYKAHGIEEVKQILKQNWNLP